MPGPPPATSSRTRLETSTSPPSAWLARRAAHYGAGPTKSHERSRDRIDAIYASERLKLPLDGILLVGY